MPYELPANQTRSVFKSLSSPGGGGYNELRIEDRKGQEQIFVHGYLARVRAVSAFDITSVWKSSILTQLSGKTGAPPAVAYLRTQSGGYDDDKTGRYTDQFALGVHMDLEKILGWKATEFQFTVTERNRRL